MPPPKTAVNRLAEALVTLQASPLPGGIEGLAAETFDGLAPYLPFAPRIIFANRWLLGGMLESQLAANPVVPPWTNGELFVIQLSTSWVAAPPKVVVAALAAEMDAAARVVAKRMVLFICKKIVGCLSKNG